MSLPYSLSYSNAVISSPIPEELSEVERRWVSFQPYLLSKGYQLRPRYRPEWTPSWKDTNLDPISCEDSGNALPIRTLDATRLSDSLQVMIKMVVPSGDDREGKEELDILRRFSSEPYSANPKNHVVDCLDSFTMPGVDGGVFYVMPLLRDYDNPPFQNLEEIYEFLVQVFEGLQFLHEHDIAHCDIASANIMMNGRVLYNEPFHPFHQDFSLDRKRQIEPSYQRSQIPIRYYFIDFGYAKWFRDPNEPRLVYGSRARERTPEQLGGSPYDPFKADIYQLGAILRRDLIPRYPNLQSLLPLAREMTHHDPTKRLSLERAYQVVITHFIGLAGWRRRWPILPRDATLKRKCITVVVGVTAELVFLLRRLVDLLFGRSG